MRLTDRLSLRTGSSVRAGSALACLLALFAVSSVAYSQQAGKRRSASSESEIPSAMETLGSSSVPIIDGKPMHPPAVESSAKQSTKQAHRMPAGKPSWLGRMGTNTKRFFAATGDMFGIRRTETKSRIVQNTGWQQPVKPQKKKSWFGSLFTPQEEEPATPQEWLAQPRPKMF
ncbi:MAG: hypothetical protein KF708_10170 [Pirellulales bacterium]|nr:hypothetical protein [Pirellulales bacterium]